MFITHNIHLEENTKLSASGWSLYRSRIKSGKPVQETACLKIIMGDCEVIIFGVTEKQVQHLARTIGEAADTWERKGTV